MQFACVLSEDGKLTFQWVHHDLVQVLVLINMSHSGASHLSLFDCFVFYLNELKNIHGFDIVDHMHIQKYQLCVDVSGVAVSSVLFGTTLLMYLVMLMIWETNFFLATAFLLFFGFIDMVYTTGESQTSVTFMITLTMQVDSMITGKLHMHVFVYRHNQLATRNQMQGTVPCFLLVKLTCLCGMHRNLHTCIVYIAYTGSRILQPTSEVSLFGAPMHAFKNIVMWLCSQSEQGTAWWLVCTRHCSSSV